MSPIIVLGLVLVLERRGMSEVPKRELGEVTFRPWIPSSAVFRARGRARARVKPIPRCARFWTGTLYLQLNLSNL